MTVFRFKFHHAIEQSETDQPLQATQRAFAACIRCNIFLFCFHHYETLSSNMPISYNNNDQKNEYFLKSNFENILHCNFLPNENLLIRAKHLLYKVDFEFLFYSND